MTMQQAAQQALDCQDACNGGGLVKSLDRIICEVLRPSPMCTGTDWINEHPVVYMFLYKLMSLNGHEPLSDLDTYTAMEARCGALAKLPEVMA